MKPLTLLFHRLEDGERRWVDIVIDIPNRLRAMCKKLPRSASTTYSEHSK
jgi:hypothetical protein